MAQTSSQDSPSGLLRVVASFSLLKILYYAPILLLLRFFIRGIYRIYFHPLSKFPGPKIRAATRIPNHIETWRGTRHHVIAELHRKYGHVVRINHDELSWTDPNSWKDIYGHGTKNTAGSVPHKAWQRYGKSANGEVSLITARDTDHNRQRKIFTPAFSDRALKEQEPLFLRYTDLLVSKLRDSVEQDPKKPVDFVRMANFTTFDIMGDLTFGEPLHMLDNAEYDPWVSIIFSSIRLSSKLSLLQHYPRVWNPLKAMLPRSLNQRRMKHFNHSVTRVTKRLEKGRDTEGVDLWDLVLSQKEGRGLSRGEMDANASLFMVAGTETTATLVAGLTFYLLKNPRCMKILVEEIRGAFLTTQDMTMEKLAALPYLAACIKEAFRLYPPVPLGLPRLTPPEGSTVCGQFIPPDTILMIPQAAMYTHEKNFKQPREYIPERWMGDPRFENDQRQALQPFSVGSRDCVGKNLAYHEMRLLMAKVLYSFDFELDPECENWADQETYILWQKKPLMCRLRPVEK